MKCPYCGFTQDRVVDSRESKDADSIRRRRECEGCNKRFTTYERIDEIPYMVVKKDGRREKFDRQKVLSGLLHACEKRPVAAVSCGILLWLVTFMACIPVGLFFAHRGHLSLRKLSAESHQEQGREEQAEPLLARNNPHGFSTMPDDAVDGGRTHPAQQEPRSQQPRER